MLINITGIDGCGKGAQLQSYFSPAKPLTNLLLEDKHIAEFGSFYDELFRDDRLCTDIEAVLADADCGESFWASTKMQLDLLQRLEKVGSTMELARNRQVYRLLRGDLYEKCRIDIRQNLFRDL